MWALTVLGLAVASMAGCSKEIVFECAEDAQCVGPGGVEGLCQPGGYCSYEDADCPSEQRYSNHAAPDLAGYCVPSLPGAASAGEPDTAAGGSSSGDDGLGGSTGAADVPCTPTTLQLESILAACRSDSGHDPVVCMEMAGPELIMIDTEASQLEYARVTSYVAFVAPQRLDAVVSAQLWMWTHDDEDGSDAAGEVWRTNPFNGNTLRESSPALIDVEPIALDPGNAPPGARITYDLDPSALEGESTFHFALLPKSDDGLRFVATGAPDQTPQLVVEYCAEP